MKKTCLHKQGKACGLGWLVRNGSQLLQESWEKSSLGQRGLEDCVGWRGEVKAQPSNKTSKHSNVMN